MTPYTLTTDDTRIATQYVAGIIVDAIEHPKNLPSLIVYDQQTDLAKVLTQAYRQCLPDAQMLDFDATAPDAILAVFAQLPAGSLVVLLQSTHFRLDAYRLRVELFKQGLKVIEHPHLSRMQGLEQRYYIDALAYDKTYYRGVGAALKRKIDQAQTCIIHSANTQLVFSGGLEPAKLNVGDYRGMENIGGMFPIGEVFTEAKNLENVQGKVRIFAFGDTQFLVNRPATPITLVVEKGRVIQAVDSTPEMDVVLDKIHTVEGEIWVRELGFGLNRTFNTQRITQDVGTYERMCGVHLSLGAKHMFPKPQISRSAARYHIDVFAVSDSVTLDGDIVYQNGQWINCE